MVIAVYRGFGAEITRNNVGRWLYQQELWRLSIESQQEMFMVLAHSGILYSDTLNLRKSNFIPIKFTLLRQLFVYLCAYVEPASIHYVVWK